MIARLRAVLVWTVALVLTLAMEVALRLEVLRRAGGDDAGLSRAAARIARLWGSGTWEAGRILMGGRLQVEGDRDIAGRFIVLSNHQSSLDILLLLHLFPRLDLKFVAMEALRRWKPGVSLALRANGCAFVRKTSLGADLAELGRFGERMERLGGSPLIFPEGMRSRDGDLLPFNFAGVEAVRRTARLPILPVTIDGLSRSRTLLSLHALAGATARVRIGEPVPCEAFDGDPREAYGRVEQEIRESLRRMRG